jgi:GTP cyclohydrolase III
MQTYTVSVTFNCMSAKNPLDAAKKASQWLIENEDASKMVYEVMDEKTRFNYTVDLSEFEEDAVLPND